MNNHEAHFYLEELQRMMTQHRGIFSEEFVCANGMAILALEQEQKEGHWIPCSERLPESDGYYLVTNSKWGAPWREITLWMTDGWSSNNEPIAWMPLPEPWKGEDNEAD